MTKSNRSNRFGHFEGVLNLHVTEPPDRREWWECFFPRRPCLIVASYGFSYVDPDGRRWAVPYGSYVNGLTTPWFLWRLMPPFSWREIWASVVHDVACFKEGDVIVDGEPASFQEVHQVLYLAMRCKHVHPVRAWWAWLGVRMFGPRF